MTILPQQVSSSQFLLSFSSKQYCQGVPGQVQYKRDSTCLAWQHKGLPWQKNCEERLLCLSSFPYEKIVHSFQSRTSKDLQTLKKLGHGSWWWNQHAACLTWEIILSNDQENKWIYWNEASPSFCLLHGDFYVYFEIFLMKIKANLRQASQKGCVSLMSFDCLQGETGRAVDLVQVWIQRTRTASSHRGAVLSMCWVVMSMSPSLCRDSL